MALVLDADTAFATPMERAFSRAWRSGFLSSFAPASILFLIGMLSHWDTPGLYMDSVNPDYLVVKLLNTAPAEYPAWSMPLLFHRFPILIQVYHGALPYYLGLPAYALFGTGVLGVRMANAVFGLAVLLGLFFFLNAFRVRRSLITITLVLIALDPGFLFSFRTQFYITLLSVGAIFAAAGLIEYKKDNPQRLTALASGLLASVSAYGYFIHIFFIPAVALFAVWRWRESPNFKKSLMWISVGLGVPLLPYVAVFLAWGAFGLVGYHHGLYGHITQTFGTIHSQEIGDLLRANTTGYNLTLLSSGRIGYFAYLVLNTVTGKGPAIVMLGEVVQSPLDWVKILIILGAPVAASYKLLRDGQKAAGFVFLIGLFLCFFVPVAVFGYRLGLHHAIPLLPVFYAMLAMSADAIVGQEWRWKRLSASAAITVCGLLLLFSNITVRNSVFTKLAATGGVGLASDATTRYSLDSLHESSSVHYFFPDWGVFMPFVMITGGEKQVSAYLPGEPLPVQSLRQQLCAGMDVEVAMNGKPPDMRLAKLTKELNWGAPKVTVYEQLNKVPVLWIARWPVSAKHSGTCAPG